jgi:ankyrin repeat protein
MEDFLAAVRAGDVATVRAALDRDPSLATARDENGLSAVLAACFHHRFDVRDALLAADPPLDVLEAAATGRVGRLRELLDAGGVAPLEARTPEGFDPIGLAAFLGGAEAVRVLLEHGASPDGDPDNVFGVRPVHAAVANRDAEALKLLLDAGADPNVRQQGGLTPLHAAAQHELEDCARALLDAGADPSLKADDGRDAAAFAPAGSGVRALLPG